MKDESLLLICMPVSKIVAYKKQMCSVESSEMAVEFYLVETS